MNKKAASMVIMVFELIIVLTVIVLGFNFAEKLGSSDSVIRERIKDDIVQMMYAGVSVSGDFVVAYPANLSAYTILLSSNEIAVTSESTPVRQKQGKKIILPSTYTASGVVDNQEVVCLEKQQKIFILRPCTAEEAKFMDKPATEIITPSETTGVAS